MLKNQDRKFNAPKGERGIMKNKNIMFSFAAVVCFIVAVTAFVTGCGGGNNPSGPAASSSLTTTQQLTSGNSSIKGRVVTDAQTPLPSVTVNLLALDPNTNAVQTSGKTFVTTTSGEFTFNQIATGVYVLKVNQGNGYLESSKLAEVTTAGSVVETGDFVISLEPSAGITASTLDITGKILSSTNMPLSTAQVSLDTGQTTVTDALGNFSLSYVASGTRKMTVVQPGAASYTISFEVLGNTTTTATGIKINGATYTPAAGTRLIDFSNPNPATLPAVTFKPNPNLHQSGVLRGTVKRFKTNTAGFLTNEVEGYPSYEFDLWIQDTDKSTRRFDTIKTDASGTWRRDQLPPFEDNSYLWFAVPVNTTVQITQGDTGNVAKYSNSDPIWANRDPILTFGYKVQSGQTTVMDFTVPSFVYTPTTTTVLAISDSMLSVDGGAYANTLALANYTSNLNFRWTGPGTATQVLLEFNKLYTEDTPTTVSKTITLANTTPTQVTTTSNLTPAGLGLNYGRYRWKTVAIDPNIADGRSESDSYLLTIRPSNTEVSPANGTNINISNATYTVQFVAPKDPDANKAVLELYQGNELLGRANETTIANEATFQLTFTPNSPAVGDYTYKIVYFYNDGPPMESETVNIRFQ